MTNLAFGRLLLASQTSGILGYLVSSKGPSALEDKIRIVRNKIQGQLFFRLLHPH